MWQKNSPKVRFSLSLYELDSVKFQKGWRDGSGSIYTTKKVMND